MPNKVAPVGADLKAPSNDAETEPACDHSLATVQWETACFYMPEPSEPSPKQSGAGRPAADAENGGSVLVKNSDHSTKVGLVRLGPVKGRVSLQYQTVAVNATPGKHYSPIPPTEVVFEDGEYYKCIPLTILYASSFDGTLEFTLQIIPESVKGAVLGKCLRTATVKIVDSSTFPSERCAEKLRDGNLQTTLEIPILHLVYEYIMMNIENPIVRKGTIKALLVSLYHNIYSILTLVISYNLVKILNAPLCHETLYFLVMPNGDGTFNQTQVDEGYTLDVEDDEGYIMSRDQRIPADSETYQEWEEAEIECLQEHSKISALWWLGIAWVVPFGLKHYLDYRKCFWKIGGASRKRLQVLLMRKFFNYTEDSRKKVKVEALVMGMTRDVNDIVTNAYVASIELFGSVTEIAMLVLWMLSFSGGKTASYPILLVVLVFPILTVMYIRKRQHRTNAKRREVFKNENSLINHVIHSVFNFEIIHDYDKKEQEVAAFTKYIDAFNKVNAAYNGISVNSKYFAPWIGTLIVGVYMIHAGHQVVRQKLPLADFLSTISVFRRMSAEFVSCYQSITKITSASQSIAQVSSYMNLPVDGQKRLTNHEARLAYGQRLMVHQQKALHEMNLEYHEVMHKGTMLVDELPIKVVHLDITHEHASKTHAAVKVQAVLRGNKRRNELGIRSPMKTPSKEHVVGFPGLAAESPNKVEASPGLAVQSERGEKTGGFTLDEALEARMVPSTLNEAGQVSPPGILTRGTPLPPLKGPGSAGRLSPHSEIDRNHSALQKRLSAITFSSDDSMNSNSTPSAAADGTAMDDDKQESFNRSVAVGDVAGRGLRAVSSVSNITGLSAVGAGGVAVVGKSAKLLGTGVKGTAGVVDAGSGLLKDIHRITGAHHVTGAVTKFGKATGAHGVLEHGVVIVGGVTSLTADITGINDATRLWLSAMGLKTREDIVKASIREKFKRARNKLLFVDDYYRKVVGDGATAIFEQGNMIAIIGEASQGKVGLLRSLANSESIRRDRSDSFIFVPPHLRVVEVGQDPIVLGPKETLADNLLYGLRGDYDRARELQRALRIMKRLGLSQRLLDNASTDYFLGEHGNLLSRTDRVLIHLGRALIMNPEVLMMHKPTVLVDNELRAGVFRMMREFVSQRGVEMDSSEPYQSRRVRTIIYSASTVAATLSADRIFKVEHGMLYEQNNRAREKLCSMLLSAKSELGKSGGDEENVIGGALRPLSRHESGGETHLSMPISSLGPNDAAARPQVGAAEAETKEV